jgi:hypothetical protein
VAARHFEPVDPMLFWGASAQLSEFLVHCSKKTEELAIKDLIGELFIPQ